MLVFQNNRAIDSRYIRIPDGTIKILYEIEFARMERALNNVDVLHMKLREVIDNSYGYPYGLVGLEYINQFMDELGIERIFNNVGNRTDKLIGKRIWGLIPPLGHSPFGLVKVLDKC